MKTSSELYAELLKNQQLLTRLIKDGRLSIEQQRVALAAMEKVESAAKAADCRENFITFVKHMWGAKSVVKGRKEWLKKNARAGAEYQSQFKHAGLLIGDHHRKMADVFERIANGTLKRAYIAMPPRYGKSEFGSVYFPSWYMGRFPDAKIMQISHTVDLVQGFGSRIRDLVAEEEYQRIFPGVNLSKSSKAKTAFETQQGGIYTGAGVGGAIAGKGADLAILDDPHSEQDVLTYAMSSDAFGKEWEWFKGFLQRFQPDASLVVIATRWWKSDIPGRIMSQIERGETMHKWEVIEIPALLDENTPNERSSWPEMWPTPVLQNTRREQGPMKWSAQYQQKPLGSGMNIIPRGLWKDWTEVDENSLPKAPPCNFIIQAIDAANSSSLKANYTAIVTMGVFMVKRPYDDKLTPAIILLDAERVKLDYPELKKKAGQKYREYKPDVLVIEKAQAGVQLYQELKLAGLPVQDYIPTRGPKGAPNSKPARYQSIKEFWVQGSIYAPLSRQWVQDVVNEMAEAPFGENDDLADGVYLCVSAARKMGLMEAHTDNTARKKDPALEEDEEDAPVTVSYW